jgi:hypothetical protein
MLATAIAENLLRISLYDRRVRLYILPWTYFALDLWAVPVQMRPINIADRVNVSRDRRAPAACT